MRVALSRCVDHEVSLCLFLFVVHSVMRSRPLAVSCVHRHTVACAHRQRHFLFLIIYNLGAKRKEKKNRESAQINK